MRLCRVLGARHMTALCVAIALALQFVASSAPSALAQNPDSESTRDAEADPSRHRRPTLQSRGLGRAEVQMSVAAGDLVYLSTARSLYLAETGTGALTYIGDYDDSGMFDIAMSPDGSMYGVADYGDDFVRIDPATAATTYIGRTGATVNGLGVTPDGTIVGSGYDEIYTIDRDTGHATLVGQTGGFDSAGDLSGGAPRPLFFASDVLTRVDLTTGRAAAVGSKVIGCLYGLAETASGLFGATCRGEFLKIDRSTGAYTVIHDATPTWYGMASLPWDGNKESTLTCNPGSARAITQIPYGRKVGCRFKPGTGARFKKWLAPHFVGQSTNGGATFTARQGGAGTITAVFADASGATQKMSIDFAVTVKRPKLRLPFAATSTKSSWGYSSGPHCDHYPEDQPGSTCPAGDTRYAIDLTTPDGGSCANVPPAAASRKPARAAAAGTVRIGKGKDAHGRTSIGVQIDHGGGFGTGYYHLTNILVKKGQRVVVGQALGYPACVGRSSGTHLHFYVCHVPVKGYCDWDAMAETSIPISGTVLGGWKVGELPGNYNGTLKNGDKELEANRRPPKIPMP